jgi:lipoate-protein ligase A
MHSIHPLYLKRGEVMANYIIQSTKYNPWYNLAVEYYLMTRVKKEDVILYLWQNQSTVVIGKNQNALRECKAALLEEEHGHLARRTTGGGAVYQDMGNVCFTFLASPERYDLKRQSSIIIDACRKFGINTYFSGRNDILTEEGFKFSGNAFSSTQSCNIQHGTLMIDVDTDKMARYLTPSSEKIKAKGVTSVRSRVCNLKELNETITTEKMKEQLSESFEKEYGNVEVLSQAIMDNEIVNERFKLYSSWEWKYGKSPDCEIDYQKRFDWGEIEVQMHLEGLIIRNVKVYSDALDVDLPQVIEQLFMDKRYDLSDFSLEETENSQTRFKQIKEVVEWIGQMKE